MPSLPTLDTQGMGLHRAAEGIACVSVCVPTEGRATEQEDRQKYLPSSRAPHRRCFPPRKAVLGLISAVPTTLDVHFNISSYVTGQEEGNIFLQRRKQAQD